MLVLWHIGEVPQQRNSNLKSSTYYGGRSAYKYRAVDSLSPHYINIHNDLLPVCVESKHIVFVRFAIRG